MNLIEVRGLKKYFYIGRKFLWKGKSFEVRAVDDISFDIMKGEVLGLVGESGCGKSTTARLLLRLIEPTAGDIFYAGQNILQFTQEEMRKFRTKMQIIFQDPFASLNPRKTVFQTLSRPFLIHGSLERDELRRKISDLLERVGLSPPQSFIDRYPHQLSGGQRQRVAIARAISLSPEFLVADEPVSSLDISVRAQILKLLKALQIDLKLTCLFITHDLSVVRSMCNRVAVMYLGKIVELGSVEDLYMEPLHPYTQALLSAVPVPDPLKQEERSKRRIVLKGETPSPMNVPPGCRFNTRCPYTTEECRTKQPDLIEVISDHWVACFNLPHY
jgi:oligopeptide transport system ATP-binding protein